MSQPTFTKKQAYGTSGQSGLFAKMEKAATTLAYDLITHGENFKQLNNSIYAVVGELEHVPQFYHPILYGDKCFIDHRAYINKNGRISNVDEANFITRRGGLDHAWVTHEGMFAPIEGFIIDVFSSWVSYGLNAMTGSDLRTTTIYRIILAVYYAGLFETNTIHNNKEILAMLLIKLAKFLGLPTITVNDVLIVDEELICELYKNGHAHNQKPSLKFLCEVMTAVTSNGLTITEKLIKNCCCSGAVIISNAETISIISLEHVPTLMAMLSISMNRNLATKTRIGKTLLGLRNRHLREIELFEKMVVNLTSEV